jgi:hypothetical protein
MIVGLIINALLQRHIQRVVLTLSMPYVLDISCAREEITVPMEGDRHDSVGAVKCLFYSITMVHIDVYVQDSVVVLQQF